MFLMNADGISFTNNEINPIRPWFKRMVDQLETNVYKTGFNWNEVKMSVVMHSNLWDCVSYLYAFNSYYDYNRPINKNVYFTVYTDQVQMRQKEYLADCMLPIGGRLYPVIFNDNTSDIHFITCIFGQSEDSCLEFSGCIQNIHCYTSEE